MNKFITDNTNICLVYRVDGHIYRSRERERERERERYNIRTLAENIKFICTNFRK
jgi:hypothetical protein